MQTQRADTKPPRFKKTNLQRSYQLYSFLFQGWGFFPVFVGWGRVTKQLLFIDSKSETIIPNRQELSTRLLTVLKSKVVKSKNTSEQQKLKVLPLGNVKTSIFPN